MTTYEVTAWCNIAHHTTFEVEAGNIAEALEKARELACDETGELCDAAAPAWNEFEITSAGDTDEYTLHLEPARSVEIAAPALLAALARFEEAWRSWADGIRAHPKIAAACELFSIYEQARAAIAEAHGRPAAPVQPTTYNVHLYREMRLFFPGIVAESEEEAARVAADKPTGDAQTVEDCEGINTAALVDVEGDNDYTKSRIIDLDPHLLMGSSFRTLDSLKAAANACLIAAAPELLEALRLCERALETRDAEAEEHAAKQARAAIASATQQ